MPNWSIYNDAAYKKFHAQWQQKNSPLTFSIPADIRAMLDQIALGEGTDWVTALRKRAGSGYDISYNNNAYGKQTKPLTQMTFDEVYAYQTSMLADPRNQNNRNTSSVVGRYQIKRGTLLELRDKLGLKGDELFDANMQDHLAASLLDIRGLSQYRDGQLDAKDFQDRLAKEWASVPKSETGKSRYRQPTGMSSSEIQAFIHGFSKY